MRELMYRTEVIMTSSASGNKKEDFYRFPKCDDEKDAIKMEERTL